MIEDVFKAMANDTPALAGLSLSKIGDLGVQVIHEEADARTCPSRPTRPITGTLPTHAADRLTWHNCLMDWQFTFISLAKILGVIFVVILPLVSYTVYAERRVSALIQDRIGPNRTGIPLSLLGFQEGSAACRSSADWASPSRTR